MLANIDGVSVGNLGESEQFLSGTKYRRVEWAEFNGQRFKAGDVVTYIDEDEEGTEYTGQINWIILIEDGNVQASVDAPLGRLDVRDLVHVPLTDELILSKFLNTSLDNAADLLENEIFTVYTEAEAQEMCEDYIHESLWAFKPSFLARMTGIDEEGFIALAKADLFDDANPMLKACIDATCGMDEFIAAAIASDTRGHFNNTYDGSEFLFTYGGKDFVIYQNEEYDW